MLTQEYVIDQILRALKNYADPDYLLTLYNTIYERNIVYVGDSFYEYVDKL